MLNQPKPPTLTKKVDKSKGKMVMNFISLDQLEKSLSEGLTCYALVAQETETETELQISGHKAYLKSFLMSSPKIFQVNYLQCETFSMTLT